MDVNESIKNESVECVLSYGALRHTVNIRDWFTRSHPSKEETYT
jgi:hypothetical protein